MKFIIEQHIYYNTLKFIHPTYQKAERLRAASISKLDNAVNKKSIFNTKYAQFFTKW